MNKVLQGIKEASEEAQKYYDYINKMDEEYGLTVYTNEEHILAQLDDNKGIILAETYVYYDDGEGWCEDYLIDFENCGGEDFYVKIKNGLVEDCMHRLSEYDEMMTEDLIDLLQFSQQLEDEKLDKMVDDIITRMKKDIEEKEKILDNL